MNILQILPELNVGGVETGTVDFAKYLVRQKHKAVVISNGGAMVKQLIKSGASHHALPVHKKSLWTMIKLIKEVRRIILDEKIDIVHARSRVPAWISYFACRKTPAAFITTCHGYYNGRMFSQVMGWSKFVIVPSKVIGRHMVEDFKVQTRSIRCIPRSVDLEKYDLEKNFVKSKSSCRITIIGRLTPLKGHPFFLKAMAKVVRSIPYAKVWVVGDAPAKKAIYKEELERLTLRLGLENHVEFLGNRKDIPKILEQTDVLVMSSVTQESFGRVILEAQAAGVPVVATNVGGVVDIIDDKKTGLLVLPKDSDAMAEAVIKVANDPVLAEGLVKAAKIKLKKNFTLEHMAKATMDVYAELLSSNNILVLKIGSIGDVVLVTASLKAIRKKYPSSRIFCLVGKESMKVLQNCPYIDGVIPYDYKEGDKGFRSFMRLSKKLRKYRFDKAIDFQNNRKSHWLGFLSFVRESYGYDNGKWSRLLTRSIKNANKSMPPVAHQFQLLKMIGIHNKGNEYLELWPTATEKEYVQSLLDSEWLGNAQNIVGINIGASAKWQTKNWPLEHMARLCDALAAKNIRVVITGVAGDVPLVQKLLAKTKSKPANMAGKTDILQLAALISRCKVYVTPDSAPLHVAAAMKVPVIALFGPTDSKRHIPPAKKIIVLEKNMACAPCYSSRCRIMTHACMEEIQPELVISKIDEFIGVPI